MNPNLYPADGNYRLTLRERTQRNKEQAPEDLSIRSNRHPGNPELIRYFKVSDVSLTCVNDQMGALTGFNQRLSAIFGLLLDNELR